MNDVGESQRTLSMSVSNTGFLLDRLGQDCAPLQFLRELTQNAIEAVLATPDRRGSITWDVDWIAQALTGTYRLAVIDNGVGMTGPEMIDYINKLSSSARPQSYDGNYGVGAKIAAATRNHAGLVYLSWKSGRGAMVHLWRDHATGEYGLKQFQLPDGRWGHWAPITDDLKPDGIEGHGTMAILLGNEEGDNTMAAPPGVGSPSRWVTFYLNTRYFRLPQSVTLKAREGWENPRSNTDSNVLRTLTGQEDYLNRHSLHRGQVPLTGATANWWILKDETALSQNSGNIASSGHIAALYQDELYEMASGRSGTAKLQNFGVIFGYNRVVIYLEPLAEQWDRLTSNTARTHLLVDGNQLPWADWAAEFRSRMPTEIKALMDEVTEGAHSSDHRQAIRERLRQIRDLFRLSRYRPSRNGPHMIDPESLVIGGQHQEHRERTGRHRGGGRGGSGGDEGNVYALFVADEGTPAEAVVGDADPVVTWVSAAEGTRSPPDLDDRAARFLEDQNRLLVNADFRVFTDFVDRWAERYREVPGAREVIADTVREWFEQTLIEAVIGARALYGSREWSVDDLKDCLSEEALSTVVMPRYHIEMAVRRALGARLGTLRDRVS